MRQLHTPLKQVVAAGALLGAAYAIGGSSASAQTTSTTSSSTTTSTTTVRVPRTTATQQMIDDAVARSKARHKNFLLNGKPEQWGSEEPFVPAAK
jgi:ABC-type glycerol-3-phosphate transport system substrate-binding protein